MPPAVCAFWLICLDFFFQTPHCDRCAGLLGVCLICASGQIWVKMKHPTRWLLHACSSFSFPLRFLLFKALLSETVCLFAATQPGCVCTFARVCRFAWWDVTSAFILPTDTEFRHSLRVACFSSLPFPFFPSSSSFFFLSLLFSALSQVEEKKKKWN